VNRPDRHVAINVSDCGLDHRATRNFGNDAITHVPLIGCDRDFGPFMRCVSAAQVCNNIEVVLIVASGDYDAVSSLPS
jgi:hypothetical protein